MPENLYADYDQLLSFLNEYHSFSCEIGKNASFAMFRNVPKTFWRAMKQHTRSMMIRRPEILLKSIQEIATESDRKNPLFAIVASEYPLDALSREIERRFPGCPFERLKELHKSHREQHVAFVASIRNIFAVLFGTATIVLQFTPKPLVIDLGIDYGEFQTTVFWVTVSLIGYVSLAVIPAWYVRHKDGDRHCFVAEVLAYTSLRLS